MGLAQYNGEGLAETKVVYYNGTATLKAGEIVCYDDSDTTAPVTLPAGSLTTPPTSAILPRNLRGRQVVDPTTANLYAVAGVVSPESSGVVGPGWINLIQPRRGDVVSIYNNVNCTAGTTVLGPANGTRTAGSISDSTFNFAALAVALQTVDNSGTAGQTLCKFA